MTGPLRGGAQRIPRFPLARPGPIPAWARPGRKLPRVDRDVVARLATDVVPRRPLRFPGLREAAVLVAFMPGPAGVEIVFVKRPSTAPTHPGEIAFPGGRRRRGEGDLADTALREAGEEIGTRPGGVEIVGRLPRSIVPVSRHLVTPYAGWLADPSGIRADPAEIERVFTVLVDELADSRTYRSFRVGTRRAGFDLHVFDVPGETIWGLTGQILANVLDALFAAVDVPGSEG